MKYLWRFDSRTKGQFIPAMTAMLSIMDLPDKLTTNTKGNDSGQNGREYPTPACRIVTYKQTISIKAGCIM